VENGNKKEWLLGNVPKSHFFSDTKNSENIAFL
jgi:hypothetical protein